MVNLSMFLYDLEFEYIINADNKLMLVDQLGANFNGIELEEYEIDDTLPQRLVDRLDKYIYDYHISGIEDTLFHECQYKDTIYPYDEKLIPAMKKYPEQFDDNLVEYIEDIVNANIDITELTKAR